jgi:hypothetical protein
MLVIATSRLERIVKKQNTLKTRPAVVENTAPVMPCCSPRAPESLWAP